MLSPEDYRSHDAIGLAALVRAGEVSAAEVTDAALTQVDLLNPAINAVILRDDAQARLSAQGAPSNGPLAAVPFLAKDINVEVRGWPLTNACRFFADAPKAETDNALARRWREAGLVVIGRSNTPEFATDFACEPELYGPALNPWDTARTPGGSSGGAAAAVAAGLVPIAHASDSGGSIRVPAGCCGIFGFKPSSKRVATGSDLGPLVGGLNCDHVVTRTVRDSAVMLDATAAPEEGGPCSQSPPPAGGYLAAIDQPPLPLRIGLCASAPSGQQPSQEIADMLNQAGHLLESLGHEVTPFDWPAGTDPSDAVTPLWASEIAVLVDMRTRALGRPPQDHELGPVVRFALDQAASMTIAEAARLRLNRWDIRRRMVRALSPFDIVLSPVTTGTAIPSGLLGAAARRRVSEWAERAGAFAPYTEIYNLTGQPAMSVPLYQGADGLPVGMQFAAQVGQDALLLRLARQLEQAAPWAQRRPPIVI
jgi:amidase